MSQSIALTIATQTTVSQARRTHVSDAEIARTSPPELRNIPDEFWQNARIVVPVSKQAISIRLDTDVIEWFRATGPKYQTRINAVLRSYVTQVSEHQKPARKKRAG